MTRRSYSGNAPATTLSNSIDNSAATVLIPVASITGYPTGGSGNFYIVIDRGLATEEKVLCASASGSAFTAVTTVGRGADGTTKFAHTTGAIVEHCVTAVDLDEANAHVNDVTTDVHPQYTTTDELATHAAAADPHAVYQLESGLAAAIATNHPNLAAHDTLGLATQAELDAAVTSLAHPNLAAHDTLGLATQAELDAIVVSGHPDLAAHDTLGLATQSELDAHGTDTTSVHGITDTSALSLNTHTHAQEVPVSFNDADSNYTLVLADAFKVVERDRDTANTLTIPPEASVLFPDGTVIEVMQLGPGQTTITPGAGVEILSPGGALKIAAQYGSCSLRRRESPSDSWAAEGNLTV